MRIIAKMYNDGIYRCGHSPSNDGVGKVVLRDLGIYFQVEIFACRAFAIKNAQIQKLSPGEFASTHTALAVKFHFLILGMSIWFTTERFSGMLTH